MFNNLVECAKIKKNNKRTLYFAVTSALWTLALFGSVIGGIFLYDAKLDEQLSMLTMLVTPPPPAAPAGKVTKANAPVRTQKFAPLDMAIRETPTEISHNVDNHPIIHLVSSSSSTSGNDFSDLPGSGPGGPDDGKGLVPGLSGTNISGDVPEPKEPEIRELKVTEPIVEVQAPSVIRRSEGVIRGNTITQVKPEYPVIARNASVSGDVKIDILIGEDGSVVSANIISGHALLQQAALKAAKQWRFNPTMLSGNPVKVQGILTFRFTL